MAVLKPAPDPSINIASVLSNAGVTSLAPHEDRNHNGSKVSKIFAENGAGIEDTAQVTAAIMHSAESEGTRLQACRLSAEIHKMIDRNVQVAASPEINITLVTAEKSQNLVGVLMPNTAPIIMNP